MEPYPWIVVVHVAALFVFFVAHGAAAAVAFRLRTERDLARVRTLLELSAASVGVTMSVSLLTGVATGIWAASRAAGGTAAGSGSRSGSSWWSPPS